GLSISADNYPNRNSFLFCFLFYHTIHFVARRLGMGPVVYVPLWAHGLKTIKQPVARVFINEYTARVSPFLSFERLECEFPTDILSGCPTLDDLGVKPTRLEDRIHHIVFLFRRLNYYWDGVGEFPEPPNPPLQIN
ncbi:putative NADH-ubiquinone oxidoreductase 39 kD subunit, partial [Fasciola gigantica]